MWKLKLNCWICTLVTLCCLLTAVGCSKSEIVNGVPSANDPSKAPAQNLPTTPGGGTAGLPDLSRAVPVTLADTTNYLALYDISENAFFPLSTGNGSQIVGDFQIQATLTESKSAALSGSILLAFEDAKGFWWASVPTFLQTGTRAGVGVDVIFADDLLVVRLTGTISGGVLTGATVTYRVTDRLIDPSTGQQKINPATGYPMPAATEMCQQNTQINRTQDCRNSMATGAAGVKTLGTLSVNYSSWVTFQ